MKVFVLLLFLSCLFISTSHAQPVWQANTDGKIRFYQTTDFGIVLAGTDNSLYAFDGQTGERLWRKKTKGLDETAITPIPATDLVLLSLDEGDKSRLEAVDLLSGNSIWRTDKVKGDVLQLAVEPQSDLLAAVLVKKAKGKVGENIKRSPVVHVFRLSNGDELWKKELQSDIELMPSRFDSDAEVGFTLDNYRAPLILDGRLFLFYEGVTSYDAQTGKEGERDKFKVNEDGLALTEADPVFDERNIYTSGRGKIRAVNRRSGKVEWEAKDLGVTPEIALLGNVLYVRTGGQFTQIKDGEIKEKGDFGVSAIDAENGKILWRYKGADKGLTNFVFADANTIAIADRDDLITIDARNGKRIAKISHKIEKAQFVLINEKGEAVVGGTNEIAAFQVQSPESRVHNQIEFQTKKTNFQREKSLWTLDSGLWTNEVWRVRHNPPSRGILKIAAGIALRATALYFRYGGLATSAFNLARGGLSVAQTVNSFRWSGLKARFSSVNLSTLASNSAKNYVSRQINVYGIAARNPNLLNRIGGIQIPNAANIRGKIINGAIDKATPSQADVQESVLDKLDPTTQLDKLSNYFFRRQRLAALRENFMYFYTDLPSPFDKKGLVGVNVNDGQDARFILSGEPDARFVTDEAAGLLYSANDNRIQAFDILQK
ncbi:MAG: PQQ-binding-like beta-propeller repeat protein [Pyrinomonadaceae bacterium]